MKTKLFLAILAFILMILDDLCAQTNAGVILYVLAPSGLNLRETDDPNSSIVAKIPYGAQVSVLTDDKGKAVEVDQMTGNMQSVSFLGNKGYVFDGYLSHYPAPKGTNLNNEELSDYANTIRQLGYEVLIERCERDYGGYFQYEESLSITSISWREAFLLAKQLYRIPEKIYFPRFNKQTKVIIPNPDKKEVAWSDEMEVEYDAKGEIKSISYNYRTEGSGRQVSILKDPDDPTGKGALRVSNLGIAD